MEENRLQCPKCGRTLKKGAEYCGNCGCPVSEEERRPSERIRPTRRRQEGGLLSKELKNVKWYLLQGLNAVFHYVEIMFTFGIIMLMVMGITGLAGSDTYAEMGYNIGASGTLFFVIGGFACHIMSVLLSRDMYRNGEIGADEVLHYLWKKAPENTTKKINGRNFDRRSNLEKLVSWVLIIVEIVSAVMLAISGVKMIIAALAGVSAFVNMGYLQMIYICSAANGILSRVLIARGTMSEHHIREFVWEKFS